MFISPMVDNLWNGMEWNEHIIVLDIQSIVVGSICSGSWDETYLLVVYINANAIHS